MDNKQKEAIQILNKLQALYAISDEEYFMLLDFVISNKRDWYIPYTPIIPQPSEPWKETPWTVTYKYGTHTVTTVDKPFTENYTYSI